jgi:O-antigen ligase
LIRVLRAEGGWLALAALVSLAVGVGLYVSPVLTLALVPIPLLFVALVLRPTLALPFLLVALLVSDGISFGVSLGVPVTVGKLAMVMVIGAWFTTCLIREQWPLRPHRVWLPLGATGVVLVVGVVYARAIGGSGIDMLVGYLMLLVVVVVVEALVETRHLWTGLRMVAWGFVIVVGLAIVVGREVGEYGEPRSVGFGGNANEWAAMVLVGLGPTVAILENEESWLGRIGTMLALVFSAVSIFLTVSRSGIVVYVALLPFIAAILWRQKVMLGTALAAVVAGVVLFGEIDSVWTRFDSFVDSSELELDGSVRDRSLVGRFAIEAFTGSPIIGIGTGGFLSEIEIRSGGQVSEHTHNTYLQILAENGVIGFVVFAWAVLYFPLSLWRSWRAQTTPRFRRLVLGLGASLAAFLLMLATMNGLTLTVGFYFLALILVVERVSRLPAEELERARLA